MSIMLNAIELPENLVWVDEFDWQPVAQSFTRAENGVNVREESPLTAGRPITLGSYDSTSDWITRAVLIDLQTLAATVGGTHTLALADGRTYSVAFTNYPKPIEARPIVDYASPAVDDWYALTLHLITV